AERDTVDDTVVAAERPAQRPACPNVPEQHRSVDLVVVREARPRERAPVRTEGHAGEAALVRTHESADAGVGADVPEHHRSLEAVTGRAGDGERAPVRAERDAGGEVLEPRQGAAEPGVRAHIPEQYRCDDIGARAGG